MEYSKAKNSKKKRLTNFIRRKYEIHFLIEYLKMFIILVTKFCAYLAKENPITAMKKKILFEIRMHEHD
jgi:hypothetical protein